MISHLLSTKLRPHVLVNFDYPRTLTHINQKDPRVHFRSVLSFSEIKRFYNLITKKIIKTHTDVFRQNQSLL